ncbi:unnamed protein product [Calypogeia fissa]
MSPGPWRPNFALIRWCQIVNCGNWIGGDLALDSTGSRPVIAEKARRNAQSVGKVNEYRTKRKPKTLLLNKLRDNLV